ncbi:MAG TPA: GWxTD domain-containing protein [Ignavibacteriales bacterium]|nr:GWxTD domain-containing protein [Ignavibacteriales bacterium]
MKKILAFLIIVLSLSISAQTSTQVLSRVRGVFFDAVVIPSEKNADCYVTYHIAYNRFVFTKDKDVFTSRFSLTVEAQDSLSGRVYREIVSSEHRAKDFEETNSEYKYFQGFVKLSLPAGTYKVTPIVNDLNTSSESLLPPFGIKVNAPDVKWALDPIVVKEVPSGGKDEKTKVLAGLDGNIPFSEEDYDLIIPVEDTTLTSVFAEMKNNDSIVFKDTLKNSFISRLSFSQDEGNITTGSASGARPTRNFILPGFNEKLQEGDLYITLKHGNKDVAGFKRSVVWYNKPRSLNNLEYAVKVLKNIAPESEVAASVKAKGGLDYKNIVAFWKKFDPTPLTAYNELMAEFYERVDYALKSFSLISNPDGADTDRGKIYIKFGKPKSVERVYTDSRDVSEVWTYDSPERRFIFVDKTGLGNFMLNGKL